MITAGPTYEKIDPVRFIGNYSSGKMGFALAEACASRGADVTLITGPVGLQVTNPRIHRINVESAEEMYGMAMQTFPGADAAILCAAVADYRPATVAEKKIKRSSNGNMTLELTANKDIAASLGAIKKPGQVLVGFALETNDEISNAEEKLNRKNLDFIVMNSLREEGAGFQGDTNKISILTRQGDVKEYPLQLKTEVAVDIVDQLIVTLKEK